MCQNGYLLNREEKIVTLSYADQNTEVIYESVTIINNEPTGTISVIKTNENGDKIKGATFRLTAAEDIYNVARTKKYYSKGDTIAVITTGENGTATKSGIPLGKVSIKEESVPERILIKQRRKNSYIELCEFKY